MTGLSAPSPARTETGQSERFASMSQNAASSALRAAPGGISYCSVSRLRPENTAPFIASSAAATLATLSP